MLFYIQLTFSKGNQLILFPFKIFLTNKNCRFNTPKRRIDRISVCMNLITRFTRVNVEHHIWFALVLNKYFTTVQSHFITSVPACWTLRTIVENCCKNAVFK